LPQANLGYWNQEIISKATLLTALASHRSTSTLLELKLAQK